MSCVQQGSLEEPNIFSKTALARPKSNQYCAGWVTAEATLWHHYGCPKKRSPRRTMSLQSLSVPRLEVLALNRGAICWPANTPLQIAGLIKAVDNQSEGVAVSAHHF